jgi:hypothetical protein
MSGRRGPRILFPLHEGSRTPEEFRAAVLAVLSEDQGLATDDPREAASVSNCGTTTPDPNTTDPPPRGGGNGDPR